MTAPLLPYAAQLPTRYVPAGTLAKAVLAFLSADVVIKALLAVFSLVDYQTLQRFASYDEYLDAFTVATIGFIVVGLFSSGVSIALLIAWCLWQYRVHANLAALERPRGPTTPGWGVGVWFIPVVNLFFPFFVMRHLLRASTPASETAPRGAEVGRLTVWWALWLFSSLAAYGTLVLELLTNDLGKLAKLSLANVGVSVLSLITTALAITIVREIQRRQDASALETPGLSICTGS